MLASIALTVAFARFALSHCPNSFSVVMQLLKGQSKQKCCVSIGNAAFLL
jgi:hypothetical protein